MTEAQAAAPPAMTRSQLLRLVLTRLLLGLAGLGALFFIPAGTLRYWQAWVWLAVLIPPMLAIGTYMFVKDPALLERRMHTREPQKTQSLFVKLSLAWFLLTFIIPGLDRRFHWSQVPTEIVIASDVLVLLGYVMIVMVFRENSYASRVVEVSSQQRLIDTGPYAVVRHPMYLGGLILYCFTPLALGSYWAVLPVWMIIPLMIFMRIPNEEEVLRRELPGYEEYMQRVKHRLIPGVW